MPEFLFGPVPHEEAIKFIADKPVVSRDVFDQLLPELKARAFTISGIESANVMQSIRDMIAEIPAGGDWDTQKKLIADELATQGIFDNPDADAEEREASRIAAERRAELLLRTHGFQAYAAARHNVMDQQRDAFPFWMYQTVGDEHVRDEHAALDGVILPSNSNFWQDHFPPWDWGCRCLVVPMDAEEVAEIRESEKDLDGDKRSLLEGELLHQLETNGRIARGPTQVVDVRSPRDKGREAAYQWNPGDLRIPISQLKGRYDAATWKEFEDFARRTKLDDGKTVWSWLKGAKPGVSEKKESWKKFGDKTATMDLWGELNMMPSHKSFSPKERSALAAYQSFSYYKINRVLREGEENITNPARLKKMAVLVDSAMKKSVVPENIIVHRGIRGGAGIGPHLGLKENDVFIDKGFISTSVDEGFVKSWSREVRCEIRVPRGSNGIWMDNLDKTHADERELLLPRDSKFLVLSRTEKDGILYLTMELIK